MEIEVALFRQSGVARDAEINDDEAMARMIEKGDTDAWGRFFDRYASWAYRFAYRHLNGNSADAEDVCSDIMLTAARSMGKFNPQRGDLDMWMSGIARHRLARFCCNRRLEIPLIPDILDQSPDPETTPANLANRLQVRDAVNRALASLPERQATVLVAKYIEGYTTGELAQRMQSSPKATESLLGRARVAFRLAFNKLLGNSAGGDDHE